MIDIKNFEDMPEAWRAKFFRSMGRGPERADKWCGACDHFQQQDSDARFGECRANLPKINKSNWMRAWPTVARGQWCGKFARPQS